MIMLILAVEILAILANLALPMTQDLALRGHAVTIAREMRQIRDSAIKSRSGRDDWSPSPTPDALPAEVAAALPSGFALPHEDYRLVWERWSVTDPSVLGLQEQDVAAVTVITTDPRLAALVAREIAGGQLRYTIGDRTTLIVQ